MGLQKIKHDFVLCKELLKLCLPFSKLSEKYVFVQCEIHMLYFDANQIMFLRLHSLKCGVMLPLR
jgi:hypothetical protein